MVAIRIMTLAPPSSPPDSGETSLELSWSHHTQSHLQLLAHTGFPPGTFSSFALGLLKSSLYFKV